MTRAVCFACGEMKFGAFNYCGTCKRRPISDDDLMLSLTMTDRFLDDPVLERLARDVKLGHVPELDEKSRTKLLPQIERVKAMLGLDRMSGAVGPECAPTPRNAARWWRFWTKN
jgi:hypothetical protein